MWGLFATVLLRARVPIGPGGFRSILLPPPPKTLTLCLIILQAAGTQAQYHRQIQ
jgi:hypothetical protein